MTQRQKPHSRGRRRTVAATLGLALAFGGLVPPTGAAAAAPPAAAPAAAPATAAPAAPVADILDVDFTGSGGAPVDHAQNRAGTVKSAPVYGVDSHLNRTVASFDGVDDGVVYALSDAWDANHTPNITKSVSVECVFRFDAALPVTAEKDVCSGKQTGGYAIRVTGSTVQAQFYIGGAYQYATAPIESNTWYHTVSVYDGSAITLYVNGLVAATTPVTGVVGAPPGGYFGIGADTTAAGAIEFPAKVSIANVRLFSQPLTAAQVTALNLASGVAGKGPSGDILDISFAGGVAVDAAQNLPPKIWGAPTFGTDAKLRSTPTGILGVDGVDDAVSFEVDPWAKLATGFSIECVFRIDAAMPVSGEKDLCSDKESGGFSIYLNGANLGTMAYIGGAYKSVVTPVDGGRWYHALSVWDGSTLTLYLNGTAVASTAATGVLKAPVATSLRFVVGGDAAPTGVGQLAPPSSYAAAGVYSRALTAAEAATAAARWNTAPAPPQADILDVDFADGTPVDHAQNLTVTTSGSPTIGKESALDKNVGTFDGVDDAYAYAFGDQWSKISTSVSIECTFRFNGTLPASAEKDLCSDKEAGGYSIVIYDDQLTFTAYVNGAYKSVATQIVPGRWYHAVGTWDGSVERLYVDGKLAKEAPVTGTLGLPSSPARNFFFVGADSVNQFFAPATILNARVFSKALSATQVAALNIAALGETRKADVDLVSTVPARNAAMTSPVDFAVEVRNAGSATRWVYTLDGQAIQPGQRIGAGLSAGRHTILITAVDVFGTALKWEIPFTSAAIPVGGGVETGQGKGTVTLSAIATDPDGGKVTTTFKEAAASVAEGGFQGVVPVLPAALEFTYSEGATITGKQNADGVTTTSPSTGQIPFQRYDVPVTAAPGDQQVAWTGVVDPERSVTLRAWNPTAKQWVVLATARGKAQGDTALAATVRPALIDGGTVHVLITGEDPFADDISPRNSTAGEAANRDHFENPDDYDFSLVHFTDTQYLSEGAVGGTYDDWDGIAEPSDVELAEEQAVWAKSYRASTQWIADNAKSKKIAYTAHTGDVIENDISNPTAYPGLDAQVDKELAYASGAQKTLDDAGVINQLIAGNHDNQSGNETGPTSRFSRTFSPDRYYDLARNWPTDQNASYHAWDETTDADGKTVTRGKDNQNNYVLFSKGGLDFVAVGLSYGVTAAEAAWATSVFQRYHDRNGILITHAYLAPSTNPDGRGAGFSTDGSRLYQQVVEANPNVFLVLAGHEHGVGTNLKSGIGVTVSHNVVELLADYQFYTVSAAELFPDKVDSKGNVDLNGDGVVDHKGTDQLQLGASFLRLLQFDVSRSEMSVDTYSPMLDNFGATEYDTRHRYNGSEDNMVLPVDLTSRTTSFATDGLTVVGPTSSVIGESTARSGWPASVSWSGLVKGQTYAWTSTSRTVGGELVGTVDQFGGMFLATAAGTDTKAPVLTVPARTDLTVGDIFDPLAGVTAVDDSDGDVKGSIQLIGSVNTQVTGTYALTYLVADGNGNQAVAPRVVVVTVPKAPELTSTSVTVGNVGATFGKDLTLTAAVVPATASGKVTFMTGEETWCEATIVQGNASCVVRMLPPPGDSYVVTAFYTGDQAHKPSHASFVLSVDKGEFVTATPVISGAVQVGRTVTVNPGTWSPAAVFGYQWLVDGTELSGATGSSLIVPASAVGRKLSVLVTGSAASYTTKYALSAATTVSAATLSGPVPTVTGKAKVGVALSVSARTWVPAATLSYQWYAAGAAIKGATGKTFTPGAAQWGKSLTVAVTGKKAGYSTLTKTSKATAKVVAGTFSGTPVPKITGAAKVGSTLTAKAGTWKPKATLSYQWYAGKAKIAGAKKSSLRIPASLRGKSLTVVVTARAAGYTTTSVTSARTSTVRS
ncbi:DUF5011 domain-containing protein [Nakamurella silvestris]|nr:DUF5011 domain-containing protein [Nakamurella silvestris]